MPKETCVNGNIDTSASALLNEFSRANPKSKCELNEVCCQYGGEVSFSFEIKYFLNIFKLISLSSRRLKAKRNTANFHG